MEFQRKQYLVKNTALFALNSFGTRIITFFLVPFYTRAFTTMEYGVVDLITTIATIFVPLITVNIGEAVMRFALDENSNKNHIMSVGLFFMGLSFVWGISVIYILSWFPDIQVSRSLIYLYCISQGIYQILSCNLRGREKLLNYAVANILNTFLAALLNILFLVVLKIGINGYFYAYIIAFFTASIYCFMTGNGKDIFEEFHIDWLLLKGMVKYSIVLVPNSFMWWIMNSSDHVMVTKMISMEANGVYAVSYKLPSILSVLSMVFNQAWAYSAIHESKSKDHGKFCNIMYDKLVGFQLIITVMLMCTIRPFLKIYVHSEYFDGWKYTPYLLVGNFFLTMATFLSVSYTVNKDSKGFLFSGMGGAVTNVCLNWLMIPVIGVHGAALATCISYMVVFFYRVRDTSKYVVIHVFRPKSIMNYIILIVAAFTMFLPSWVGQWLLVFEVGLVIVINRRLALECFKMTWQLLRK